MRASDRRYVESIRESLFNALGRQCRHCGVLVDLTFDHIGARPTASRRMSQTMRAADLKRSYMRGLLQVLCRSCNSKKGREGRRS